MESRVKVLYFSAWYPHRYDAMSGLFVRKHAQAAARYCDVGVLYLYADDKVSSFEIVEQDIDGVHETYVYYPFTDVGILRQVTKAINYVRAFIKGYNRVEKTFGRPDVTQANVLTRSGALSWWLKRRKSIPYIVVEHWSRYLPQNFNYKGFFRKRLTETIVNEASCVMAVSRSLRSAMQSHGLTNTNFGLVNNVVDDGFYNIEREAHNGAFRFLHVSCFDERPKNVCGILRAFRRVVETRQDVTLTLVGYGKDWDQAVDYSKELGLTEKNVVFTGEKAPEEVCQYMAESDCFIMFSRYENAPVVISEALSIGLPIISSRVGGIADMVADNAGILIESEEEQQLTEKMLWMTEHSADYNSKDIRDAAYRYSFDHTGEQLYMSYLKAIY